MKTDEDLRVARTFVHALLDEIERLRAERGLNASEERDSLYEAACSYVREYRSDRDPIQEMYARDALIAAVDAFRKVGEK